MIGCLVLTVMLAACGYAFTINNRWSRIAGAAGVLLILACLREYLIPNAGAFGIIVVSALAVGGGVLMGFPTPRTGVSSRIQTVAVGALLVVIAMFAFNDGLLKNGPGLFDGLFTKNPRQPAAPTAPAVAKNYVQRRERPSAVAENRDDCLPDGVYDVLSGSKIFQGKASLVVKDDNNREWEVDFPVSKIRVVDDNDQRNILEVRGDYIALRWSPQMG